MNSNLKNNDLTFLVEELSKKGDCSIRILSNQQNEFIGITYQDKYMQTVYNTYPEMVLMDATYKLVDIRMPVYILCAIDGNGMTEVVFVFLVVRETADIITEALNVFKIDNPAWEKTVSFMTDKDFVERGVIRNLFPAVNLLICRYHTLRTFRREVTCEKMDITSAQREKCLEILRDMVYARNEEKYESNRQRLLSLRHQKVISNIAAWHGIRDQWVEGLSQNHLTFGETTNNRLESLNSKKSVCHRYASMPQFFAELRMVLSTLRNERMHRALNMSLKRPTDPVATDLEEFRDNLTLYAFHKVARQHDLSLSLKPEDRTANVWKFESSSGPVTSTSEQCT
jgi:zinc finger SWIM domain-containing protein 3